MGTYAHENYQKCCSGEKQSAKVPGSASLAWLLLKDSATHSGEVQILVDQLKRDTELTTAFPLVQQFALMARERMPESIGCWRCNRPRIPIPSLLKQAWPPALQALLP